mmetsp:Transcript_13527/g.20307  ORF Transcript_13527/g.20307 Transcript_13527/m.20307 type:complete len:582 (+) Transcript_13527:12-1757(+)
MASSRKSGKCNGYSWSQTYEEFDIKFPLPQGSKKRSLKPIFRNKSLVVKASGFKLIEGTFQGSINVDDSCWTVDANVVEISIVKSYPDWWKGLFVDEMYIDEEKDREEDHSSTQCEGKDAGTSSSGSAAVQANSTDAKESKKKKKKKRQRKRMPSQNKHDEVKVTEQKDNVHSTSKPKNEPGKLGQKGHGHTNARGNEGEEIEKILEKETACEKEYKECLKTYGKEHPATLHAALELMDQWIGNYRLSLIDNLLMGPPGFYKVCEKVGGQWHMKAVQMLAFCRWKQFRYRESLELFYKFQSLAGKSAILLENIGHTHNSLGDTDKAEECFAEALDRIQRGERGNKGGLLMGLGIVRKSRGDLLGAVDILLEALDFYQETYEGVHHSIVAKCHSAVAAPLKDLRRLKEAEHHYYQAVHLFWITCGDSPLTANAIKKLADVKIMLGMADEAQQLYQSALELHVSFDTLDHRALIDLISICLHLHLTNRYSDLLSRKEFEQYLPPLRTLKDRLDEVKTVDGTISVLLKGAAELAVPAGGYRMGIQMLQRALKFFRVTKEADCTRLIRQSEEMIKHAREHMKLKK